MLRAGGAYESSPGPSQCFSPQGIVCEVHLWCVVKEEHNAVRAVISGALTVKTRQGIQ